MRNTDSQHPGRKKSGRKEKKQKSCRTSCRKLLLCRPEINFCRLTFKHFAGISSCFRLLKSGFKYLGEISLCFLLWVVSSSRFQAGLVPSGCLDKNNDDV